MAPNPAGPQSGPRVVDINSRKTERYRQFGEIGVSGIKRFGGTIYEEFLTNLQGLQGVKTYREMSDNDDIIGACLYAIEQVITRANWFVEPVSSSNEDKNAAQFLQECMNDMSHSWLEFISETMSMLVYGWVWFEIVYKLRKGGTVNPNLNSRYKDGKVGWRKISRRMQSTLDSWEFDESGGVQAMNQLAPPDYNRVTIPISKSLLFRTKIVGNNPEGRSILRNTYRLWYIKKNIQMIEAIGIERDLIGLPILTPPEDFDIDDPANSDIAGFANKLLGNLRRDEQEGVMLPPKWTLTLLQGGTTRRQFDTDKIINRYDKREAVTLLAQFMMLGMDRVGSFALSDNQNDLFLTSCQSVLNNIAETINKYAVPKLFALNPEFTVKEYPRIIPGKVSSPNLTDLSNYIGSLGKFNLLPNDPAFKRELLRIGRFDEPNARNIGSVYDTTERTYPKPIMKPVAGSPAGSPAGNDGGASSSNNG